MDIKERQKIYCQKNRAKKRLIKHKGIDYSIHNDRFTRENDLKILGLSLKEARDKFNLPYYDEKDNPEPSKESEHQDSKDSEQSKDSKETKEIKTTPELFVQDKEEEKEPKTNCCDNPDNWYWLDANDYREREAIKLGYTEVCSKCYNLK